MTTTRKPPARKPQVTVIPDGVKVPEDRKQKAEMSDEETEAEKIKTLAATAKVVEVSEGTKVTMCGFSVVIPEGANDDFELMAAVQQMDSKYAHGEPMAALAHFPEILRRLAGENGYQAALNGLRGDNGRVRVLPAIDYVNALLYVMGVERGTDDED